VTEVTEPSAAARSELTPTGKLRVGLSMSNFLLTKKDPAGGEPGGIAADLGREQGFDNVFKRFVEDKLDALAGLRPRLITDQANMPGSRILDGNFTSVQQASGTPKGRPAGAQYLREFIEDVKASGLVARLIEKHSVRRLTGAPAA